MYIALLHNWQYGLFWLLNSNQNKFVVNKIFELKLKTYSELYKIQALHNKHVVKAVTYYMNGPFVIANVIINI